MIAVNDRLGPTALGRSVVRAQLVRGPAHPFEELPDAGQLGRHLTPAHENARSRRLAGGIRSIGENCGWKLSNAR